MTKLAHICVILKKKVRIVMHSLHKLHVYSRGYVCIFQLS